MARYNSLNPGHARVEYLVVLEGIIDNDNDAFDSDRIDVGCFGGYGRAVYHAKRLLHVLAEGAGDPQPYEEGLKTSFDCEGYPLWYGDVHAAYSGLGNYIIMISVIPNK